jgi:hypothetical protein
MCIVATFLLAVTFSSPQTTDKEQLILWKKIVRLEVVLDSLQASSKKMQLDSNGVMTLLSN